MLELDCLLTLIKVGTMVRSATFDVVVYGTLVSRVEGTEGGGTATTLRFELPGKPESIVEIWLAHSSMMQLRDARIPAGNSLIALPDSRPVWVHYGSSISDGGSTAHPTDVWTARAAAIADVSLVSLGMSGECQLDQFAAARSAVQRISSA